MNQHYFQPAGLGLLILFFFASYSLPAQLRLNVAGDAKISGAFLLNGTTGSLPASGAGTRLMWIPEKKAFRAGEVLGTEWDNASIGLRSFVGGGRSSTATGSNSFVGGGEFNKATGGSSFVGGGFTLSAGGFRSFAGGGASNSASGEAAFIGGGFSNIASGINSFIAGGRINQASGENSFATGFANYARSLNEAVFGMYSTDYTPNSVSVFDAADRLFVIGNGTDVANRSNAITVLKSGKVGIGTNDPAELLTIENPTKAAIRFTAGNAEGQIEQNSGGGALRLMDPTNNPLIQLRTYGDSYFNGGQVGIGTANPWHLLDLGESIGKKLAVYQHPSGEDFYGFGIGAGTLEFHASSTSSEEDPDMTLTNAGNLGIGTRTPQTPLHIKQNGTGINAGLRLEHESNGLYWEISTLGGELYFSRDGSVRARIMANGSYAVGAAFANPNQEGQSRSSDFQIQPMETVLRRVKKLNPITFQSYSSRNAEKSMGFDPDEVTSLFPEITPEVDGQKGIIYDYFGVVAIKAIQELQVLIESLEEKVEDTETLKEQVRDQQQQIDELRSLIGKLIADQQSGTQGSYVLPLEQQAMLAQNQPNPFHQNTVVNYFVPGNVQDAKIQVTSADGKVLGTVAIAEKGEGQVTIKADSYPAGTYFYSLVLDGRVMDTKRMVLTR